MKLLWALSVPVLAVCVAQAAAQTPAPRTQAAGTVTAIDAQANQISLRTDKGDAIRVSLTEKTPVVRIPAGETDVKKGAKIPLSALSVGDRVVAVGQQSADGKSVEARSLLVRTKSDLAQAQQREAEDWRKRGTTGMVTAIDPASHVIKLKVGQRTVTVQPSDKTGYHQYSRDSARFADAKPATFAAIQVGDQLRALGNKNAEGTSILAERIVFGTFRQIAATITALHPETGEMQVKDLATKKPLTIRVDADTTMRKLPEMMARMMARRYQSVNAAPAAAGPGPAQGGGRGGGGDVGQMLDRLPATPFSELKTGDAIMVSTTLGTDPTRVTAITLLAGVEPLLTASPTATRDIMSGWNLGGGEGEAGGQ